MAHNQATTSAERTRSIYPLFPTRIEHGDSNFKQYMAKRCAEEQIEFECAMLLHCENPSKHTRLNIILELADIFFYVDRSLEENDPSRDHAYPNSVVESFFRATAALSCSVSALVEAIDAVHTVKAISHSTQPLPAPTSDVPDLADTFVSSLNINGVKA